MEKQKKGMAFTYIKDYSIVLNSSEMVHSFINLEFSRQSLFFFSISYDYFGTNTCLFMSVFCRFSVSFVLVLKRVLMLTN